MLISLLIAGCDQSQPTTTNLPAPTFGESTITGHVRFLGKPRPFKLIDNKTCHASATPIPDETLVVSGDQSLMGAIVYLKDAPSSDGSKQPTIELDQKNCRYFPHVVALQVGQNLRIKNSDPVYHNSHYVSQRNSSLNIGLANAGDFKDLTFKASEFFNIRCDVHPWMGADIGIISNPFFSVTDENGNYSIERVIPGRYTIVAHHALLGEIEQLVEIGEAGAVLNLDFVPMTTD
ncbi:MAG TPA: carboxypeptidase regulatory-like domain-containing protein [Tepidisphaeraceae bacterium]|nr:carboxypeptidase regulatory-like domain-containing protein [Tepidisphaeraceae bacterium]